MCGCKFCHMPYKSIDLCYIARQLQMLENFFKTVKSYFLSLMTSNATTLKLLVACEKNGSCS